MKTKFDFDLGLLESEAILAQKLPEDATKVERYKREASNNHVGSMAHMP